MAAVCMTAACADTSTPAKSSEISREIGLLSQKIEPFPSLEFPEINEEIEYPSKEEIEALDIREDMLAYWMVLNNKRPFISMNEGGQKFYLNEYCWYLHSVEPEHYHANYFMIVDMDGDGLEEVVLECSPGTSEVLHYEEGEVYSYQFGTRGMKRIHISGIYEGSDGAASTSYHRFTELNKDGYTKETIAVMDRDYYEVEGKETTGEELDDYVESIESVELAECMEFTESMFDRQLLGSLSEEEIALIKRIPAENMIENEPNYQEYKLALQSYAGVLKGEEEIIYVIEDTFWDELSWVYFSIVDMDGDGVNELVFTSDCDVIQILHYEEGKIYGYQFRPFKFEITTITTDGVFQTDDLSSTGYAKIVSFDKDGYEIEPVEDYESSSHDRIRYYYFSEDTINQWLAPEKQVKTEQQEEKNVLIVKDEKVLEDCVFVAFINNEVSTHDLQENNEKYLLDYLKNYHMIYGIHYMAEDLNNDNENELLILIQTGHDFGDLLVFEKAENGKFITWDIWEDFLIDRLCEVYYCGNATFERIGGLGISIGHYTQEGKQECLMDYYTETREYYDTYDVEGVWLRLYENGEVVNEIDYEYYYDRELDEYSTPLENKEKETKCDELVDAMLATLGEEKAIKVQSEEYRDKIETVSLEELLNP